MIPPHDERTGGTGFRLTDLRPVILNFSAADRHRTSWRGMPGMHSASPARGLGCLDTAPFSFIPGETRVTDSARSSKVTKKGVFSMSLQGKARYPRRSCAGCRDNWSWTGTHPRVLSHIPGRIIKITVSYDAFSFGMLFSEPFYQKPGVAPRGVNCAFLSLIGKNAVSQGARGDFRQWRTQTAQKETIKDKSR